MSPQQSVESGPDTRDLESAINIEDSKLDKLDSNKVDNEKYAALRAINSAPPNQDQDAIGSASHPQMSGLQFYVVIGSVILAVLIMALNNTALGTAIPAITAEFNTVDDVGWYSSASLIAK
ncbi:hypothetical protein Daesc_008916 [Daldinia eschscholtzii]|uniref:Major facilitator superfamily (MFS) profile domain-containing protein n=1 Tax=Daldinia eschscholtzii TaxID=292717 RepID=A0AAX6M872_9PEZI